MISLLSRCMFYSEIIRRRWQIYTLITSLFNHFLNIGSFMYGSVIHNKIRATHVFKATHDIKSLFQEAQTLTRCGCLSTQFQHSS